MIQRTMLIEPHAFSVVTAWACVEVPGIPATPNHFVQNMKIRRSSAATAAITSP